MKKTTVFTSSIENSLMKKLHSYAVKYKMPKNKIIERALSVYFDQLKKAEYVRSFKLAANDHEIIAMTEEGMDDYFEILKKYE